MSRIYEALRKLDVPAADSILLAIEKSETEQAPARTSEPYTGHEADGAAPSVRIVSQAGTDTRRTAGDLKALCRIEPASLKAGLPVLPFDGVDACSAEQYRIIRTNLMYHADRPSVVAVSSAGPGDGKTVTAVNIAGALSLKQDVSVLLVDADMRHGTTASLLGIRDEPGLAEVLKGECKLEDAIVRLKQLPNLYVLPAGRAPFNPAELLDSNIWRGLIATARREFRFTIIDTTPVAMVTDFDLIEVVSDGVVMVVRPGHTNRKLWEKAIKTASNRRRLGTVVNCIDDWFLSRTHNYYSGNAQ